MSTNKSSGTDGRWQLYRLLADPTRLRILALVAEEELTVGELAELLDESQPNVSRQSAQLRGGGLVIDRRHGTRSFIRVVDGAIADPVVSDALGEGRRLCLEEGRLERISSTLRRRDQRARDYFEQTQPNDNEQQLANELPVYVLAAACVTVDRALAVDAGTGDGAMLDVLAPFFRRVVALDRSRQQLGRAEGRVRRRGYSNVELICGDVDDRELRRCIGEGANAVFATRMLHHAASPRLTMTALSALLVPGGELLLLDYQAYDDEGFRDQRADVWMGFSKEELTVLASGAGLVEPVLFDVPRGFIGGGVDGEVDWQLLRAKRPTGSVA